MALYDRDYTTMASNTYIQEGVSVGFIKKTYQLLAASMIAAAAGAYATMPYAMEILQYKWFIFGAEMLVLFFALPATKGKTGLNLAMLFVFTFLTGVSIVPLLAMLIGIGKGAIIGNTFLMTSVLFGALSVFAINSKSDFSSWGKPLFITMVVVFIASLVNYFFIESSIISIVITAVILILFSFFTIYDTQNIANGLYDSPVDAAVSLYIDFFNMFVSLLQLLGLWGSDD